MKLRSLQGHFGNMNGRKIEFTDGFSHLVLPNGWGKSTLCAFLRVMLYGLDTSKRDTQQTLSDKTAVRCRTLMPFIWIQVKNADC